LNEAKYEKMQKNGGRGLKPKMSGATHLFIDNLEGYIYNKVCDSSKKVKI